MKLWSIEIYIDSEPDGHGWYYPASSSHTAIARVLKGIKNKKAGYVYFREATKEEVEKYRTTHPDSRLFKQKSVQE